MRYGESKRINREKPRAPDGRSDVRFFTEYLTIFPDCATLKGKKAEEERESGL